MYEPSGTGNDTKRPRKTWYLYQSLLFLAPHVAHRRTSSNFVRKNTIITQLSPSPSQSALQSAAQSTSESSFINQWTSDHFSDDSSISIPAEKSASSTSSISSVGQPRSLNIARKDLLSPPADRSATRKMKESRKEQKELSKMIGNTTENINMLIHNLSDKHSQPDVSDDNEEEAAMAKAIIYALRRVNSKYKIQCYIECLSVVDKFQNLTAVEMVQNL